MARLNGCSFSSLHRFTRGHNAAGADTHRAPNNTAATDDGSARWGQPLPSQPGKPVGNVYYGACSWTDRTLIDAGTFYSANTRTAADRLAHCASQFPIVEVDATYYALPSERNTHLWVERTPPGFVFDVKAFGLFTHHPVVVERLPAAVKELLPAAIAEKSRVYLRDIPPRRREKLIWQMQTQALASLVAPGKLGWRPVSVPALMHRQARSASGYLPAAS